MQKKLDLKNITINFYNNITEDTKYIREEVFVKEQGFQEEFDSLDNESYHVLISYNNKSAATARFYKQNNSYIVGRFAVMKEYRNAGLGSILMKEVEQKIKELGGKKIELSAQKQAEGFYKSLGYISSGEIYYDQHAPHIHMEKVL